MTPTFRIAAIAGDGIGKEVMPEGLRVLEGGRRALRLRARDPRTSNGPAATTTRSTAR